MLQLVLVAVLSYEVYKRWQLPNATLPLDVVWDRESHWEHRPELEDLPNAPSLLVEQESSTSRTQDTCKTVVERSINEQSQTQTKPQQSSTKPEVKKTTSELQGLLLQSVLVPDPRWQQLISELRASNPSHHLPDDVLLDLIGSLDPIGEHASTQSQSNKNTMCRFL